MLGDYADATSVARVLTYRLDLLLNRRTAAEQPPVPTWLAAAPPPSRSSDTNLRWGTYLGIRYTEMADRISTLTEQAVSKPQVWTSQVGHGHGRTEAMRQTATYRSVYDHSGLDPIGPEPDRHGRQHDAWSAAHRALASSKDQAEPATHGAPNAVRLLAQLERDSAARTVDDYTGPTRTGPSRSV